MRKALLLLMLFGLPAAASASWGYVPLEKLVQGSDIIVVGTLRDVREHTADETDYGQGYIVVREVIWSDVSPGDSLLLRWQNASAIACPRVEHKYNAGEEGIWLLTRDGGDVNANYPGRFVALSKRAAVETALKRSLPVKKVRVYVAAPEIRRSEVPPAPALSCAYKFTEPQLRGLSPLVRAELAALAAFVFFPLFYRLRTNLAEARLARVLHGAQTWRFDS